jgi:hypothetical protein
MSKFANQFRISALIKKLSPIYSTHEHCMDNMSLFVIELKALLCICEEALNKFSKGLNN